MLSSLVCEVLYEKLLDGREIPKWLNWKLPIPTIPKSDNRLELVCKQVKAGHLLICQGLTRNKLRMMLLRCELMPL